MENRTGSIRGVAAAAALTGALAAAGLAVRFCWENGLSLRGLAAMAGYSGIAVPRRLCRLVLGEKRTYRNLPELLTDGSGNPVRTREEYRARREELLGLYRTYMYGELPAPESCSVEAAVLEEGEAFAGQGRRTQVKLTVTGRGGEVSAMLLVYRPAERPAAGFFVGENFTGNTAVSAEERVLPSVRQSGSVKRGADSMFPAERILRAGYGLATMYYQDWEHDGGGAAAPGLLEVTGTAGSTSCPWT